MQINSKYYVVGGANCICFNFRIFAGFTMYTTCIIWLAFVPLYFGTGNHVPLRITSMSVTISLSASVTIVCLFTPKVCKFISFIYFSLLNISNLVLLTSFLEVEFGSLLCSCYRIERGLTVPRLKPTIIIIKISKV